MIRKLICWLCMLLLLLVQFTPVQAQNDVWSQPLNLSLSGAAEQPRLVASDSGAVQVFWWDRYDGLTTAYSNGTTWTAGRSVPLDLEQDEMPEFVLDKDGRVHAFWEAQQQGTTQLWHASMPLGDSTWSVIEKLAESTLGFKTQSLEDGAIVVAFLRISQSWGAPAGIYMLRLEPGVYVWNAPIGLDTSAYYRLETSESAWLHLAADGDILTISWREPHTGDYKARTSLNGGWSWGSTETLVPPDNEMIQPRSLYWGEGRKLVWQDEGPSGCTLMQQSVSGEWQAGIIGLAECPSEDISWSEGYQLFWLWGMGSRLISLAAWDGLAWTQPLSIGFTFVDPSDDITKNLQDLHAVQTGGSLYVAGSDGLGEIWFLQSELNAMQLVEAPRPDWSLVSRLSTRGTVAAEPALAVDAAGVFHIVWLEGQPGGIFNALYYASVNADTVEQPVAVKSAAAGEFFRQPALLADPAGWLHLAWSGGTHGEIHYSRVRLEDAANPGAWSPVQLLSTTAGTTPQLARDSAGRLYLLYVTPFNEGRGVYLVRSLDEGDSWMQPELAFDAQAAGWANLGSATLAISPSLEDGQMLSIHAAWSEEALPGTLPPQGIWYTRAYTSLGNIEPLDWSDPFEVAGEGAAWPSMVVSAGNVHLIFSVQDLGVWERHIPLSVAPGDVSGWSTASPIDGWDTLPGFDGRAFGVATSGSTISTGGVIHLAGMPVADRLSYTTWTEGRWGALQEYALPGWNQGFASWVDAASLPTGGHLGLVWVSPEANGLPVVFWASRTISLLEAPPEPTPVLPPILEATSVPSLQPIAQPSPTPDLNLAPAMNIGSKTPLILGGGLAALLIIGYALIRSRRTR